MMATDTVQRMDSCWTAEELRAFAPRAREDYIDALIRSWDYIIGAGIDTPLKRCHFLAQGAAETGYFTIIRENTNWSMVRMTQLWPHRFKRSDPVFLAKYARVRSDPVGKANLAYGGGHSLAKSLGNTVTPDDGWYYRGGGYFQGTGRNWYRELGQALNMDLETDPELIEDPNVSIAAALWYWQRYGLGRFAERNYIRAVGNQINRGNPYSRHEPIGAKHRKQAFDRAWAIFGDGELPNPQDLGLGAYGSDVESLQLQLRELKYAPGGVDRAFGEETARAVAAFKADWKRKTGQALEPDDIVGPATRAALASADPISRPEREEMTEQELAERGSEEIKVAQNQRTVGTALTAVGAVGTAAQSGAINPDAMKENLSWVPEMHSFAIPVIKGFQFFADNFLWVIVGVAGVWFYAKGRHIAASALKQARNGFNLWT